VGGHARARVDGREKWIVFRGMMANKKNRVFADCCIDEPLRELIKIGAAPLPPRLRGDGANARLENLTLDGVTESFDKMAFCRIDMVKT
jgi:hypothetical protein